jgi:hypothetical protein
VLAVVVVRHGCVASALRAGRRLGLREDE